MAWDDDELDDGPDEEPSSPLLPPDDRLWRHPSEVAGTGAPGAPSPRARASLTGPPRVVTIVALTSCLSVLVTLGLVSVVRPFRAQVDADRLPTALGGAIEGVADVAELTSRLRPAIGGVIATSADGDDSWGSGVMFRSDGMMLTAHHIVEGAQSVRVVLDDGRSLVARIVGVDPDTDLAVLDVEGNSFATAPLATSRRGAIGEPTITIGASGPASASGPIVRVSMVSAVGQEAGVEGRKLMDMIRTDEAMAPSSSGGAVVDHTGMVIAIATANVDEGEGDGAAAYATPIDVARSVAEQLMATGKVTRAWLGVEGQSEGGALVHNVKPDSPATAAGIAPGDVIAAIDGRELATMSALVTQLRSHKPGDDIVLTIRRDHRSLEMAVTLGEKPA